MTTPEAQHNTGEFNPRLVIQQNELTCLSACLLSQIETDEIDEQAITRLLAECGLYQEGVGTGLFAAKVLDHSLQSLGLNATPVYEARLRGDNEQAAAADRIDSVKRSLLSGEKVLLAYPKRRPGQAPILHYSVVTGFTGTDTEDCVVVMDPSEIDGGITKPSWSEFTPYVTAEEGVPVMAWGLYRRSQERRPLYRHSDYAGKLAVSLLSDPLCSPEDTGRPVPPGTLHPSSVAMPSASITRQFAELGDVVLSRKGEHAFGYPRFVVPPAVKDLSLAATGRYDSLPFPTRQSAEAAAHLENTWGSGAAIQEINDVFWLEGTAFNMNSWQHTGLGISSRQALAILEQRGENNPERRVSAEQRIKSVIERHTGAKADDIYLFPTGMAAAYWLNQALIRLSGGAPAIQFGFPYVDTYEQRKYGPGRDLAKNILDLRLGDYAELKNILDSGPAVRGIFTEWPSNALLATPDLSRLNDIVGQSTPLIVDDTIGTMYNLDNQKLPQCAAARVTSLTKFFSSTGDVMGGSVVLRLESPHYAGLKNALELIYEDTLWYEDAEVLAGNGEDFDRIMPAINNGSEELAAWLDQHFMGPGQALQQVFYPGLQGRQRYDAARKEAGGYGGLMSLKFNDAEQGYRFFDKLRITKGPSLGTFYTLGCLYTLLAHKPVHTVKKFGLAPDLVRVSVGIEDPDDLKQRFSRAFEQSTEQA